MFAALLLGAFACKPAAQPPAAAPVAPTPAAKTILAAPDEFFTRDSARLRYREAGQGEPVLILHGYTDRLEGMEALADSLSGTFRVIVPDQRGFGESTKFADPARYGHAMGDDVIGLLDHLQIPKVHLIGHSMGAAVAADVALRYPGRIASLTLLAGPFYPDSATFAKHARPYMDRLARGEGLKSFMVWLFPGLPDSLAKEYSRRALASNDLGSLKAAMPAMATLMIPAGARPDTSMKVLIVTGTGDPLRPYSLALSQRWPKARVVEVTGANHATVRDRGETIAAIRGVIRN